jgi:hypothetical protein
MLPKCIQHLTLHNLFSWKQYYDSNTHIDHIILYYIMEWGMLNNKNPNHTCMFKGYYKEASDVREHSVKLSFQYSPALIFPTLCLRITPEPSNNKELQSIMKKLQNSWRVPSPGMKTQFEPHRKHITSSLQNPDG